MGQGPIIDQSFLEKLERLTLHWHKSFPGLIGGRHPSRLAGPGQEFLDHRHFHHGDDMRAINWRAYLRLEKLFLKMFQVEPRIPVRMLIDVSQSMGTGETSKLHYARRLAAALCYVGLVRLDTMCLQPYRDGLEEHYLCTGGRHRIMPAVSFLSQLEPKGKTDTFQVSRQFASTFPQRGLLLVMSDFLDDAGVERPLQFLADFGHELFLIHLWSPEDRDPWWDGEMDLIDAETGDHLEIALDEKARAAYTAAFDEHAERLNNLANRTGGRYVGLPTSTPLEDAIFGALRRVGGVE
jgi:uncharacterized protein (DUF58 family)